MARVILTLCAVVLFTVTAIGDASSLSAYTTDVQLKVTRAPASVKLVIHNVADRTVTFKCAELGKNWAPTVALKGEWTAIGPIPVTVQKNSILHLTVTVNTGRRMGEVRKDLEINLLKEFQYNLEGSKFLVLTATENAREGNLKIKLGKRVVLTFNV